MRYFSTFVCAFVFLSCQREIDPSILNQNNLDTTAEYTLNGSPNACANIALSGTYQKGLPLDVSHTITVPVTTTRIGSWSASSNTVNGIKFSASGKLTSLGTQTIVLLGSGTPAQAGQNTFTITAGGKQCSFVVKVDSGSSTVPGNIDPVANAGSDKLITSPVNSVTLTGAGTDSDGTITTYLWTKISGANGAVIATPNQAQTLVNNLTQGSYQFELKVTDNKGGVGRDTVTVTVQAAPVAGALALQQSLYAVVLPVNDVMQYDASGKIIGITSNYYPSRKVFYSGNLISSIEYWYLDGNGVPYKGETESFVYDGNGNVTTINTLNHSTNQSYVSTEFTYNADNTVRTRNRYNPTGSGRDRNTFLYTNGNLTGFVNNSIDTIAVTYDTRTNNFSTIHPQYYFLDVQREFDGNARSEIFYFSKNLPTRFGNKSVSVSTNSTNQKPLEIKFENVLWYRYVYN